MSDRLLRKAFFVFCFMVSLAIFAAGDPQDREGGKDPNLFTRMPGFHIYNYENRDFDRFEFPVGADKTETVEGRYSYVDYYANEGIQMPSAIQITSNYANAAKAIGGELVYEYEDGGSQIATLKTQKGDAEIWAHITAGSNGMYKITLIEKMTMKQEVTANAEALAGNIRAAGKVVVHGIFFDTDKAVLKPESDKAISEIARLLKNDPALKLYVVGHTDNDGTFDHNVKLSQARAAAVTEALVKKNGIAGARLTPFGAGPTSPAASNSTEEGKAQNRRVELVAQ